LPGFTTPCRRERLATATELEELNPHHLPNSKMLLIKCLSATIKLLNNSSSLGRKMQFPDEHKFSQMNVFKGEGTEGGDYNKFAMI
jgi:hypothetical protein